ncbi:YdcF family protein [Corynebacterium riegelii]|uniref:YdcF family protein n=1 Tax=Corynebacterium riegelii TaxID=156976 RepID=UPI0025503544|nr:YdcF family protein [Corynebacterium riegelii]
MSNSSTNPIVVLGARVADGRPSPMLESRLARALEIYHANPRPVVVTGHGEAEVMAGWLAHHGVAHEHIVIEPDATSTNENLEHSWALFPDATLLTVVTSEFHVARTRVWAWHLAIPVEVVGAPMPAGSPKRKAKNYSREVIAVPHSLARVVWRRLMHKAQGGR